MTIAATAGRDLLELDLADLMAQARAVRDRVHGTRITYSPKVFIPLTMLCRDKCGYCTFAQPPARLESPYLSDHEVLAIAESGAAAGCHEALFTLGERPELRYPDAAKWLETHGFASTVDYLAHAARLVVEKTGLLPHANAGALYPDELALLRTTAPSQGMMLETLADLDCHRGSPDKTPERRLATLEAAGELAIPFTTGILVGIGETRADRVEALEAIADVPPAVGPCAGGDRPELLAQAGHGHARRRPLRPQRVSGGHRPGPAHLARGDPPPSPAQSVRRLRRAARRGH